MTEKKQKRAAKNFSERWKGRGYEKGDTQTFWDELLVNVFDIEYPSQYIDFEDKVRINNIKFIDAYIPSIPVVIEQKDISIPLDQPGHQSGTDKLYTPVEQAKRYVDELGNSRKPKYIITCNFSEFWIYDMDKDNPTQQEPQKIKLENLENEFHRMDFLVNKNDSHIEEETDVDSIKAGKIVKHLYNSLRKAYIDPDSEQTLENLNKLCTRLVFCLYAEDAGVFGGKDKFHDYLAQFDSSQMRDALEKLFNILDTKREDRNRYDEGKIIDEFPYVDGELFKEEIEIPNFTDETRDVLLNEASLGCDWSKISPTIFGALFESTLRLSKQHADGMFYTSEKNIHKVIDPLFLNDLKDEFEKIKLEKDGKPRQKKLKDFQTKLASLKFLDPACGSGNFLTETYLSLRKLENDVVNEMKHGQITIGDNDFSPIKVSISQFYGIEINDFAVSVAKTALWIAESQMMQKTEEILNLDDLNFLPLKSYKNNICKANALKKNWDEVVPKNELSYIIGNPPFKGSHKKNDDEEINEKKRKKEDINRVFHGWENSGILDYVTCWFKMAAEYMQGTKVRAALVSTSSITQGEQVEPLWRPLFEKYGVHIDFAYRSFLWDGDTSNAACVIIGFSTAPNEKQKVIYFGETKQVAKNINAYLMNMENIYVKSRKEPLCDVPKISIGNKPIDGGNYLFTEKEKNEFIKKEPKSEKYFKPWYGADEFIKRKPRYCLWLGDCTPDQLKNMPECMKRVDAVRATRLASPTPETRKLADHPLRFHVKNMPKGDYMVIPEVTSGYRKYIPFGYMDDSVLCSNKLRLMPGGTLYHFGVLQSIVHMDWVKTVCGRNGEGYDYSIYVVYNNFPWSSPTNEQKSKIEKTAKSILDARENYPNCTLKDMYSDHMYLYDELVKAHEANDKAVMAAYGFNKKDMTEKDIVAELMKMYEALTEKQ